MTDGIAAGNPGATGRPRDAAHLSGSIRELVLLAVTLVGASRLLDGPLVWLVLVVLGAAMAVGTLQLMGETHPAGESLGVPIEALILPTVAAVAGVGLMRLVPIGILLLPALVVVGLAVRQTASSEARILLAPHGATPTDRTAVIVQALVLGFASFVGMAALVQGGLPEIGGLGTSGTVSPGGPAGVGTGLAEADLAVLVVADAAIAGMLGYRAAALRVATVRDVLWSAATYAATIGIAAAALRAMEIPRLIGPGLLTLVFYLWDTIHGAPASRRRDARRVWEAALLAILGVIVVAWTLALRA